MSGYDGPTIDPGSEGDPGNDPNREGDDAPSREDARTEDLSPDSAAGARPTVRLSERRDEESLESTEVGPYRVRSVLGEGGFGVVYLAEQTEPVRRRVALKVIKPGMDTRAVVARFEAERQALAVMDHPCIARVFDAGTTPKGRPFFVMEYVRGVPLTEFAAKQRLTLEARLKLFQRVCEAVQHAHGKGIIHRDLKPSNILVEYEDGQATPKIIDFGVAKAIDQRLTEKTIFTEQGQILGTPEYMSPEQAEMSGLDIDTRTDIYALGVVLYELLTGELPFDPKSLRSAGYAEIQRIIREVDPPKPSTRISTAGATPRPTPRIAHDRSMETKDLTRRLRRDLDWVVMKCLEKDRERRYPTATSLGAEIARYLKFEPVEAGPPSVGYRLAKLVRRRRGALASAAIVLLGLVVGVIGLAIGLSRESAARREADVRAQESAQIAAFTTDILTGVDPEVAGGYDQTLLKRIFDDAAARVEAEAALRPRVEGAIRVALGRAYNSIVSSSEAEAQLRKAVELRTSELGAEHPETLDAKEALAEALWDLGQFKDAEAAYDELLGVGSWNDRGRLSLQSRRATVIAMGAERLDEGATALAGALEAQAAALGGDDEDTLLTTRRLSFVRELQEDRSAALALSERALEGHRRTHGEDHPLTIFAEQRVATATLQAGDTATALGLLSDGLAKQRRLLGDEHGTTLGTMQALGVAHRRGGRPEAALEHLAPAVELHLKKYGRSHVETYKALMAAGSAGMDAGRHLAAAGWYADAVASAQGADGAPAFYESYAVASRGRALSALGRDEEAEASLLDGYEGLSASRGADDALTRRTASYLADLYERLDRASEAARWRDLAD
ncbi:MAG: serine/threonine-protein kinase [Planctomycetota bacterium]